VTTLLQLREFCSCRAGDKGDISDVALFACSDEFFDVLRLELTAERVAEHVRPLKVTQVDRYELPNLRAIKLVLHGALGGGGAASLRADNLGKNMGGVLLRLAIPVPDALASRAPRPRPPLHPFREPSGREEATDPRSAERTAEVSRNSGKPAQTSSRR
jgi:hypothetical protein